jgi:alkaline phosphatase D
MSSLVNLTASRRRLLQVAAASATALWLPRSAWSQPRLASNPFTLGIASGSPLHDSVVLWTRLLPADATSLGEGAVTVRWEVAHDEQFKRLVQSGQVSATAQLGHAVHAQIDGLDSDRWYFYRFMLGGAKDGVANDWVSPTGRTRTLPAPAAAVNRLRLAYASCQRWEHGYYSAWRHMQAEQLDLVLFLGDYIYEYPGTVGGVRTHRGDWSLTLDDYRSRYALYKSDVALQGAHAMCPWFVTWDDHEVQNDYAGLRASATGPTVADFAARRAAAYQAFYEHMPLRTSVLSRALTGLSQGAEMRIYNAVSYGKLAQLYLLDSRQYRDPQVCTPDDKLGAATVDVAKCQAWTHARRSLLGNAQEQWLDQGFAKASKAGWNVLAQQTLLGQRDFRIGAEQRLWNDGWDGYSAARNRLTASLQGHQLVNTVVLGGDIHENWVGHLKTDYNQPSSPSVGVEFCGTAITSRTTASRQEKLPEYLAENPHFVFADAQRKGYGVAHFTPTQLSTTLRVVSDVARPDAEIETLAQFVVKTGSSRVERV